MKTQYTKEQLADFLTQIHERSVRRFREEHLQEILTRFRAEQEKNVEKKKSKEMEIANTSQ
jgi:hypothetical protein